MKLLRRWRAPGATLEDWVFDSTLAGLGIVLALVPYLVAMALFDSGMSATHLQWAAITGVAMFATIIVRRHYPILMMILVAVFGVAQAFLVPRPTSSLVVVPFTAYTVARHVPGHRARWVVVLGAVGSVLGPYVWLAVYYPGADAIALATVLAALVCFGLVVTPYALGRRARDAAISRQAQLDTAAERYTMMLNEREAEQRAAEARIRNQIARELHDIVAHSVSVMVVQAEGGRALAAKRPEAAAEVLTTIAETGRDAMNEMRRIVGVLRQEPGEEMPYAPAPGMSDIPGMSAKAGAAYVELGDAVPVSQAMGLTTYRVVQEALTNVLKHAGPDADPVVTIAYEPSQVVATIRDSGIGVEATSDGRGHGLTGMSERVTALGGTLTITAPDTGGFTVTARLPLMSGRMWT